MLPARSRLALGFNQRNHHLRGSLTDLLTILIDARQRRAKAIVVVQIAAADNGDIFGNTKTSLEDRMDGP
jgi:hypothetical protein